MGTSARTRKRAVKDQAHIAIEVVANKNYNQGYDEGYRDGYQAACDDLTTKLIKKEKAA